MNVNPFLSIRPANRSFRALNRGLHGAAVLCVLSSLASCSDVRQTDSASRRIPGLALVDDMEDQNTQTLADPSGYLGFWYTYDDRKDCREDYCCKEVSMLVDTCADDATAMCPGTMSPAPELMDFPMSPTTGLPFTVTDAALTTEVADSKYAAHIEGEGYGLFGAGMGLTLNDNNVFDTKGEFIGIRFLGASRLGAQAVNVKIQDISSVPSGGICTAKTSCGESQGCYADWGKVVNLTSEWTEYRILFSEMTLPGFGTYPAGPPAAVDASQVFQIQFQTDGDMDGGAFDIWVDDLAFILAPTAP